MMRCLLESRLRPALASLLLLGLAAAARADESADTFTAEHVAKLRVVAQAAISPDGEHTAYALSVPRRPLKDEDGPAWIELHVVDREGNSRPFIIGKVNVAALEWTPDGKEIAFLAKRGDDEHRSLYMIPIDGGEARKVLAHETDIGSYSLSPNSDRVAFLAEEARPKDEEDLRKKGFNQQIYEEDWRPTRIWTASLDADDSNDDAKPKALDVEGSASELHWSPAGDHLAVALAPTPLVDDTYTSRKVHILNAETGEVVAKFDNPGKLGAIVWSPDGHQIAYISAEDANDPADGRLMVASIKGGESRNLIPDYEGHVSAIVWADDETIAFLGDESVWTTWNSIKSNGDDRQIHIPTGRMVLTAVALSRDGTTAAFIGESPEHPPEVFFGEADTSEPRRLTDSNPWLADMRFALQEIVTHEARDGLKLEGLLIRPLDAEESARYPLILSVHGGPEAHVRNGWLTGYSNPGQVAAAKGLAVFYPNYRGSTGRGVAFSKLGQADAAGKEFDDLVDAVDHLVEIGLADVEKVGITGGSYGGYASAWGATYQSDRFAASVMFVGISDKVSKAGTTDIPDEEYLVHARHRPWEDWQFFLERSPIYHVEKSRTPILILHGKEDPRVHPSQSLELYRYLKLIDQAPVRLVLYPGEGHGNRRAASRLDYNLRMMRWFEHYLQGPGGNPPPYEISYEQHAFTPAASRDQPASD